MKLFINRTSNLRSTEGEPPCEESIWDGKYWAIEFSDLEALIGFAEKYGDLVLTTDSIEIYDTYRE